MTSDDVLYFRFKGERNYVQGGDIFDALQVLFSKQDAQVLELSFRGFSSRQMRCLLDNPGTEYKAEGVVIDLTGQRLPFWLVETDQPVTERYAFDEDAITSHAQIDGKVISASATAGFSVIEQIIALTKALNYQIAPDINGKWVFGQLRLKQPLPQTAEHFLIQQKTLLAGRFSVQEVTLDGKVIGQIRFITSES
ncbi:hypothetical protein [Stutzerimonas nitrititolerans]|uniref:hypothetical protein n=1 Tax=Stutzerimonas nitrititolerans TaxID=2482751 RepID=UPI0028A5CBDA|nr:hypothetical protein [Stutzerimonas nitrititolerans]